MKQVFDEQRRNVFTGRRNDNLFLAAGNENVSVIVDSAQVARMQPSVDDDLLRRLRLFVVAEHDMRAASQYLAIVSANNLHTRDGETGGTAAILSFARCRNDGRRFAETVALQNWQAVVLIKVECRHRQRSAAGTKEPHRTAKSRLQRA